MTDRQEIIKDIAIIAAFLAGPVAIVAAVIALGMYFNYKSCANTADLYRLEWTWGPLITCQVNIHNKWVPLDKYRAFEEIRR
jgi:hypothetical protein